MSKKDYLRAYLDILEERMERILNEQRTMMEKAARLIATQVKRDKLIYVFGSGGHSNMMAEELFVEPPIIRSINTKGGLEANQALYAKYRPLIKWL